jgi:hypothetical protein
MTRPPRIVLLAALLLALAATPRAGRAEPKADPHAAHRAQAEAAEPAAAEAKSCCHKAKGADDAALRRPHRRRRGRRARGLPREVTWRRPRWRPDRRHGAVPAVGDKLVVGWTSPSPPAPPSAEKAAGAGAGEARRKGRPEVTLLSIDRRATPCPKPSSVRFKSDRLGAGRGTRRRHRAQGPRLVAVLAEHGPIVGGRRLHRALAPLQRFPEVTGGGDALWRRHARGPPPPPPRPGRRSLAGAAWPWLAGWPECAPARRQVRRPGARWRCQSADAMRPRRGLLHRHRAADQRPEGALYSHVRWSAWPSSSRSATTPARS